MSNRVVDKYRDLIRKSEALQNSEDFEETTRQLKQLQQDWKEVGGSLPRKQANEMWTRFRAAHNLASVSSMAFCIRASTAARVSPRWKL